VKDFFFSQYLQVDCWWERGGPKRQQVMSKEMDVSEDMYCVQLLERFIQCKSFWNRIVEIVRLVTMQLYK